MLSIPLLPVGSGGTITLKASITTGSLGQTYANLAQISSDTIELNETDNTAIATTTLGTVANLYTTAQLTSTYTPNATLNATITYGNDGNRTASGSELSISLDPNLTLLSSSLSGYTQSGTTLLWTLGDLAQQSSGNLTLQLQVANDQTLLDSGTILVLTSAISSLASELNLMDNVAIAQSSPLQGGTTTLEGHIYIDVDASHSLTDGDTKLQGQKVVRSGRNLTGEVLTDVDGKYQIINLEPGYYELETLPTTGYEALFSKGGKNLTYQAVGSGSLE
ncbi:hypothetical protein FACS1894176_06260 [Bacteroidia bacterium]|nr:hypothetical protein FACS1894176_06260 [Bacteroidia bacterium]